MNYLPVVMFIYAQISGPRLDEKFFFNMKKGSISEETTESKRVPQMADIYSVLSTRYLE